MRSTPTRPTQEEHDGLPRGTWLGPAGRHWPGGHRLGHRPGRYRQRRHAGDRTAARGDRQDPAGDDHHRSTRRSADDLRVRHHVHSVAEDLSGRRAVSRRGTRGVVMNLIDIRQVLTQVVGFLIMVFLLRRFAWGPVLGLLEARRQKIAGEFEEAEKRKAEAGELKSRYELELR